MATKVKLTRAQRQARRRRNRIMVHARRTLLNLILFAPLLVFAVTDKIGYLLF